MGHYVLDNAWQQAEARLSLLESLYDPATIQRLDRIGVTEGWNCLSPGAGSGSIVQWLCSRVGHSGKVLATDLDTHFLDRVTADNLKVLKHDILRDALPDDEFDLVQVRLLLMHLASPEQAILRLIKSLKKGGWILLEEYDVSPSLVCGTSLWEEVWRKIPEALERFGMDFYLGRRLQHLLERFGLSDIHVESNPTIFHGGSNEAEFHRLTSLQARERIVGPLALSADIFDRLQEALRDPEFLAVGPTVVAVWGRRR